MATGRTLAEFQKVYIDGYDLSCYLFDTGERGLEYPEFGSVAFCDAIPGVLVGKPNVKIGPLLGVFDNTPTSGLHVLSDAAQGTLRHVMISQGVRAAPAIGDDCFCLPCYQMGYHSIGGGVVTCRTDLSQPDVASAMLYDELWGKALHLMTAVTDANSSNDDAVNNGAATTAGGWLMYHINAVTGGAGTVTISVDDSANGTDWLALSGATSGAIAYNAVPTSGIIQLGVTATVRQYLRWQYAEASGASGATFAAAFIRGR